jgi:flagellar hook-associated protein 2
MSTTTQLSGLASGLDWQTLVAKLVAAERTPETALQNKKTDYQNQSSAITTLGQDLTDLQTSMQALAGNSTSGTTDIFSARTATVSGASNTWTASAASGATAATYQINVTQLATTAQLNGASDIGAPLSSTSDVSGLTIGTLAIATPIAAGDFTINGARVTIAGTDSLQDVFNKISTATNGSVTASYDPTTDKVELSSANEIVLGSANDTSNFFSALQLYNNGTGDILPPKSLGVVSLSTAIKNAQLKKAVTAVDGTGNGSFTINGVSIGYNVNTDSLNGIMAKINASTANVTASFDKVNDRIVLTNKSTGNVGIAVSEGTGGLLDALGLTTGSTLVHGTDAQFSINGGSTLTSSSNTLDQTATGIAGLTVTANSATSQTVTVAADTSGLKSAIQDFITKFNTVQTFIANSTQITSNNGTVTTSVLSSNHEVTDLGSSLRELAFGTVPGLSGTVSRLQSMGIDFTSGTSQLAINDSTALDNALQNNPNDVKTLFTDPTNGLAATINNFVTQAMGSSGLIPTQTANLSKESSAIDDQIAAMERTITADQTRMTNEFVNMESAQSALQSQLAALTSQFGSNTTTSK